jgi:hypothetical protein
VLFFGSFYIAFGIFGETAAGLRAGLAILIAGVFVGVGGAYVGYLIDRRGKS